MYNVHDFIAWALTHVKPQTVPSGAVLPIPTADCGIEPWEYLFGSVRVKTTQDTLDRYFEQHYKQQMSRAQFDRITKDWDRNGYATDCEGLCDAYLTYECGELTDINANANYEYWCTDKGKLKDIDRPYVTGEALFMWSNTQKKMTHVGWVCGTDKDGNTLVVEARGILYGVVVTRLDSRGWTHRGLMTKKFDYSEDPLEMLRFDVIDPMPSGEAYRAMQHALNLAGYPDENGQPLEEDGKWGKKSLQAFNTMMQVNSPSPEPVPVPVEEPIAVFTSDNGKFVCEFRENKR